jgi:hypothetical protein
MCDVEMEYKNKGGLHYVMGLLREVGQANDSITYFLQELAYDKEKEDRRGNLSLYQMELRREADIKAWDARIARKKARMSSDEDGLSPIPMRKGS